MSIRIQTILAYAVNIVVLFFFLRLILFKPVKKFMTDRENRYTSRNELLSNKEHEVDTLRQDYKMRLSETQQQVEVIITKTKEQADKRAEELLENARMQAKDMLNRMEMDINNQREQAVRAMRDQVATLAIDIASKVLEREVTIKDHQRILDEFMARERIDQR